MKGLWLALGFLTVIPVRRLAPQPGDPSTLPPSGVAGQALGRAAMWFPLIGFALGLMLAVAHLFFSCLFPPLLAAALTVAVWATLTGGLHLDGLADCCDGLLATAQAERRLEIMRDPRLGSFGVIGLTLFVVLKILATASLPSLGAFLPSFWLVGGLPNTYFPIGIFVLAASVSRWLIVPVALQPQARAEGMGAGFARGLTPPVVALAALVPLAWLILGALSGTWSVVTALALAHLVAAAIVAFARARLGGVTGDIFGLTVELTELTLLLVFILQPRI